jgi:hypothetical protein
MHRIIQILPPLFEFAGMRTFGLFILPPCDNSFFQFQVFFTDISGVDCEDSGEFGFGWITV